MPNKYIWHFATDPYYKQKILPRIGRIFVLIKNSSSIDEE
jgi:hypothetical protein